MGSLGEGAGEEGGACTRRWREEGDTEEAKWKFSAILEVEGERDGGVYEGGAGSQGRKEDEGTEASEHGMTRNKGREGKKTF